MDWEVVVVLAAVVAGTIVGEINERDQMLLGVNDGDLPWNRRCI